MVTDVKCTCIRSIKATKDTAHSYDSCVNRRSELRAIIRIYTNSEQSSVLGCPSVNLLAEQTRRKNIDNVTAEETQQTAHH